MKDRVSSGAPRRRTLFQRGLEILASVLFLVLALRGIDFGGLAGALQQADYRWLIPAAGVTLSLELLKGWRWQLLFRPGRILRYWPVFSALAAGYLASNVMPGRVGEIVRLVLVSSEEHVSPARTLSTIVIERVLDILSLLLLSVGLLPFIGAALPVWMEGGAAGLGIVALASAAIMLVLSHRKDAVLWCAHKWIGRLRWLDRPSVYSALEHLLDGFGALQGRWGLAMFVLSLFCWVLVTGVAWSVAQAFGLPLSLAALAFGVVVTTLGMLIPSTPGYIGVFHYLVLVALAPFDVRGEQALGFALVWHAVNYLTLTLVGVAALLVHGTSLGDLLHWRTRLATPAEVVNGQ